MIAGVAITCTTTLLGSLPVHANPAPPAPSTSGDARIAWQNSSHQAEVASEQVNGARQAQQQAGRAAARAAAELVAAKAKVTSTQQTLAAAGDVVAAYQSKLDAFANASFRGANLSQLSVMLTARSADDFLDESTVMNRVAQDTQKTLAAALAAKSAAAQAETAAGAAASAASEAKSTADQASNAATAAIVTAQHKKAELDAAVATYKTLYDKLSTQEKAAAAAAAEKVRQDSLAAAAAAAARAQADEAAAKADAVASSSASSELAVAAARAGAPTATRSAALDAVAGSTQAAAATSAAAGTAVATSTQASAQAASSNQGGNSAGAIAAAAAKTKIGFAYTYGGDGPDSYDCSGLTSWAWAQAGISIPRASYEQANYPEVPLDQLQPGDLVTYYSPVSHVAIYVGDGMVVSAADESLGIIYVPVERGGPDATGHRVSQG